MEHAQRWYDRLALLGVPASDERLADAKARVGLLLGAAQEAAIPWYRRARVTITTYSRVEADAVFPFPLQRRAHVSARLLERRAPLYREIGDLQRSAAQFDDALYWVGWTEDDALRVTVYRARAHVWAVQGDERRWRLDLDAACRYAERMRGPQREVMRGLVVYAEAEGLKRLAYHPRMARDERGRLAYAQQALDCFVRARHLAETEWYAHAVLAGVSEAQCLVWVDPEEAARRAAVMRAETVQIYPSLAQKVERTLGFAEFRLRQPRGADPLVFNLMH
jgi:hypothetical protein